MSSSTRSETRVGTLSSVFPPDLTHVQIVRLIVLREDLKIEVRGIQTDCIAPLDLLKEIKYRQRDFLRRSMGTLVEYAEAIRILSDECDDFRSIKINFNDDARKKWDEAVRFFAENEDFYKRVRNDLGGHFGTKAATYALRTFTVGVIGKIETWRDYSTNTEILHPHFIGEITARAFMRHLDGKTLEEKLHHLMRHVVDGLSLAAYATDAILYFYVWDRFGR